MFQTVWCYASVISASVVVCAMLAVQAWFRASKMVFGLVIAASLDAHIITSVAGMLGFSEFAQTCAATVMASGDTANAFERKGIDVLRAKDKALAKLMWLTGRTSERAA